MTAWRQLEKAHKRMIETADDSGRVATELDQTLAEQGYFVDGEDYLYAQDFAAALREGKKIGRFDLFEVREQMKNNNKPYDIVSFSRTALFIGTIKKQLTAAAVHDFAKNVLPYFSADFPNEARGRLIYGMVGGAKVDAAAQIEAVASNFVLVYLNNPQKPRFKNIAGACAI